MRGLFNILEVQLKAVKIKIKVNLAGAITNSYLQTASL
jgi:hypothetical protein